MKAGTVSSLPVSGIQSMLGTDRWPLGWLAWHARRLQHQSRASQEAGQPQRLVPFLSPYRPNPS